jgi:hypothetical protein
VNDLHWGLAMNNIVVQMADLEWTKKALHLACAMARGKQDEVLLLRMIPVQHAAWLGTDVGDSAPTALEYDDMREYDTIAHDYGVDIVLTSMQYLTLKEALIQAVELLEARTLFARLPESFIPYWRKYLVRSLESHMAAHNCTLYTLEQPADVAEWTPAVTVAAES